MMKKLLLSIFTLSVIIPCALSQTTYSGNGNAGFGGAVGTSSLSINDDGTTISITITRGSGNFNDEMVMYISNGSSGRTIIDGNVDDNGDDLRRAISNRSSANLVFPPGFEATHAVGISTDFGGLWSIPNSGIIGSNGLDFITGVGTPPNASFTTFTFNFNWTQIGLTSSDDFSFVITYGNGNDSNRMFSSDEAYGSGIGTGNPGFNAMTYTSYFTYPEGFVGGNASSIQNGDWSDNATWINGNPPLATDPVQINHNVTLNQNATISSLTINSGTFTASDGSARELTISRSATGTATTITNAGGTWDNGTGESTVIFSGAPSSGDAIHRTSGTIAFQNVTINKTSGANNVGADFQDNSSISGTLKIGAGGFVSTAPPASFYAASAILEFDQGTDAIYDVGVTDNSWSTSEVPQNITVSSGTVNLNANRAATGDLLVATDAALNVSAGSSLEINSDLTNNGTLTLNSTSASYSNLIPTTATNTGRIIYNRFVNQIGTSGSSTGNDLIALPLNSPFLDFQTFLSFGESSNTNRDLIPNNGSVHAFAPYNNTTMAFVNLPTYGAGDPPDPSPIGLPPGKGYRAATASGATLTFEGDVVTGAVGIAIDRPEDGSRWNLIGNPYPSYVNSVSFLTDNLSLLDEEAAAIYGYNSGTYTGEDMTTGNYTIINNTSNSELNIAPGQGFFVASNAAGGSVQFSPAMRTTTGTDDFIQGRSAVENYRMILALNSGKTSFYFNDQSSLGLDPGYDAAVFGNQNTHPIYSHLVANNTGRAMAIQSLGRNDLSDVTIPLGVNANAGQTLTFSIQDSTLPNNIAVFLEDVVTNTITALHDNNYVVTPQNNLNSTGRFFLRFNDSALSIANETTKRLNIYHQNTEQVIVIAGQLANNTQAYLYDLQGRIVSTNALHASQTEQRVDVSNLSNGVYVLSFENGAERISKKLIIR